MNRNAKLLSLKLNIKVAAKGKNYSIEGKKLSLKLKREPKLLNNYLGTELSTTNVKLNVKLH